MMASYSADAHFELVDGRSICKLCQWSVKKLSVRKKMEHLLGLGTGVASCKAAKSELDKSAAKKIMNELKSMDLRLESTKKKRKIENDEVCALVVPERPRQTMLKGFERTDKIDLTYARMLVMSGSRKGFMDSPWVKYFFEEMFDYKVPSRRKVMRDLIPLLHDDLKIKISEVCAFPSTTSTQLLYNCN